MKVYEASEGTQSNDTRTSRKSGESLLSVFLRIQHLFHCLVTEAGTMDGLQTLLRHSLVLGLFCGFSSTSGPKHIKERTKPTSCLHIDFNKESQELIDTIHTSNSSLGTTFFAIALHIYHFE